MARHETARPVLNGRSRAEAPTELNSLKRLHLRPRVKFPPKWTQIGRAIRFRSAGFARSPSVSDLIRIPWSLPLPVSSLLLPTCPLISFVLLPAVEFLVISFHTRCRLSLSIGVLIAIIASRPPFAVSDGRDASHQLATQHSKTSEVLNIHRTRSLPLPYVQSLGPAISAIYHRLFVRL